MDIKLDATGDISFVNGESQVTTIGAEDLAQRLLIRLSTFKGEYFMDNTLGVDWWGKVFGKNKNKNAIDAILQAEILKEPDAIQIIGYQSSVANNTFKCSFTVRTQDGAISAPVVFQLTPPV